MNNFCYFRDFEIIKKDSQGTILKASDHKGRLFAIKIDKKPSSSLVLPPYYLSNFSTTGSQSKISPFPYSLLTQSTFNSPPLLVKGKYQKEKEFLIDLQGIKGIPSIFWGGYDPEIERFLVIEELTGCNLKYYLNKFRKFSLSTTLKIALQLLKILRGIHERGIIHGNLKSSNLAISQNGRDIILVDFCFARRLKRKFKEKKKQKNQMEFVDDYCETNTDSDSFKNNTKMDDLISLGILIIYFLQGSLSWDSPDGSNNVRSAKKIWLKKVNFISKKVPILYPLLYPFFKYLFSVKNNINYDYLANVIEAWAKFEKVDLDSEIWDWSELEREENLMENLQEEFGETLVSELMIKYRVPNL